MPFHVRWLRVNKVSCKTETLRLRYPDALVEWLAAKLIYLANYSFPFFTTCSAYPTIMLSVLSVQDNLMFKCSSNVYP